MSIKTSRELLVNLLKSSKRYERAERKLFEKVTNTGKDRYNFPNQLAEVREAKTELNEVQKEVEQYLEAF